MRGRRTTSGNQGRQTDPMHTQSTPSIAVRDLTPADVPAVVLIDREGSGLTRRGYFEKRLRAADEARIALAADRGGELAGFVVATVQRGEFGRARPAASLDAIGVAAGHRRSGVGAALVAALETRFAGAGVVEIYTQCDWRDRTLLGFFHRAGFALAPRLVLERESAGAIPF